MASIPDCDETHPLLCPQCEWRCIWAEAVTWADELARCPNCAAAMELDADVPHIVDAGSSPPLRSIP